MKKFLLFTMLMTIYALAQVDEIHAQDPGDRAQKFRGTWWSGVHPNLLDEKMLSLRTLDGFGVGFTSGASQSALHYAPSRFRSLPGGDEVFPPNNDTDVLNQMIKVTEAGFMVQAYTNSENFVGNNAQQFVEFAESWKNWCDTDPEAQAFINSKSYHTKSGFPDRKYMFCYAEFILKELSLQYGQYISLWQFDSAKEMESQGDDATSGNVDDQRIFEAYANAARAGNDEIAVAFNNGRSNSNFNSYPFAPATRFDDFTFGHAFGGNNNHAEKVNGNQFNLNYQHVTRMTETDGYVHDGGNWTWDDKIVGNFNSKLSTTAWSFGPNQAWEQDDFNEWNAEALSAGGMMTWSGSYNRGVTGYYDWVYVMLKATDDYLYERGISINGEVTPPPPPPTTNFTAIPALIQAEDFSNQSGTQNESTSDTGGGQNVGFIGTGDFLEYGVSVPNSGEYTVDFRVASRSTGINFDIIQGNSKVGEISSAATGNWQNWETVSTTVDLDEGDQTIRLLATDGSWNINWLDFKEVEEEPTTDENFVPDPSKVYYIDSPVHNLRLAATGESEDAYTTSTDTTGGDVEWQFVAKGNGSWHLQRSAGGSKPRLRSDNTANADMQETSSSGTDAYFDMEATDTGNTYFFTLPDGPSNFNRLQVDRRGNVNMVPLSSDGSWESFTITEAGNVDGGSSTSPTVSFTLPTSGTVLSSPASLEVDVAASDADGSITSIDLFLNNTFIRTERSAPYTWNVGNQNDGALSNLSTGSYTLRVVATDNDGNTTSVERTFTVGGTVPSGNLALNGSASQSSTAYNGVASRAIDGNTNGNYNDDSVTHTNSEANAWWEVDLGTTYAIGDINIFNRTNNCCVSRLTNFTVSVVSANGTTTFSQSFNSIPNPSTTLNAGGALGTIVRVELNENNTPLSLAEVEVFGFGSTNVSAFVPIASGTHSYPNPFSNTLTVEVDDSIEIYTVQISGASGNLINTPATIEGNQARFSTEMLGTGLYFVRLSTSQGVIFQKVIKN